MRHRCRPGTAIQAAQQGKALAEPHQPAADPKVFGGKNCESKGDDDDRRTGQDDHGNAYQHDRTAEKRGNDPPDTPGQIAPPVQPRPPPPAEIPERHR